MIEGLEDIIQISAGQEFGLALASSGTVYSWGHSTRGELGDGTPPGQFRTLPAPVSHLTDIEKVSAGADHALALDGSGRIWAWGFGYYGSLGQGDREDQLVPVLVELPGSTVQDIAAGSYYSLFLVDGLTIGGFGRNNYWQLRNENMIDQSDQLGPVPVAFGLGIRAVFAGPGTGYAINVSNDVYAWGHNPGRIKGCCPDGASAPEIVQVDGVHDVGMVAVGGGFALFLDTEQGLAYGIGHNVNGQLGISEPSAYTGPVQLPLSGTVTHVAATRYTSALVLDGTVHVSGLNRAGILGRPNIGLIEYASTPDVPPVATGSTGD